MAVTNLEMTSQLESDDLARLLHSLVLSAHWERNTKCRCFRIDKRRCAYRGLIEGWAAAVMNVAVTGSPNGRIKLSLMGNARRRLCRKSRSTHFTEGGGSNEEVANFDVLFLYRCGERPPRPHSVFCGGQASLAR